MTKNTVDQMEATHVLTKLGWKACRIASLLRVSERTVHRFRSEVRKQAGELRREFQTLAETMATDGD